MRRNALCTLVCTLGLAAQTLSAQADGDWRFAHPQATLVGGIRVNALLSSPLLKAALDQAGAKDPSVAMGMAIARSLFRNVNEVRFSLQENGSTTPDTLILVRGALDPASMQMLQGEMESQAIDANTMLIGAGDSLRAAVARLGNVADPQSAAFQQARRIPSGYDLWFAGEIPNIPGISLPQGLNLNLRGFAIGMSFTDNIGLEVSAQTATAEQAEALVKMVREAEAKQLAGAVHPEVSVEGTTARLRVSVPAEQLMQAMQNPAVTGIMGGTAAAASRTALVPPPAPPKPATPPKPVRGTVIIQGLEGGTLEIPIQVGTVK